MNRFTHAGNVTPVIDIPTAFAASLNRSADPADRAFLDALPRLAADHLHRWDLHPDGPAMHGRCALVLPVTRADGTRAVLKLQQTDTETEGEPVALRAWNGDGAVRLLDHDPATGALLLERLDPARLLARHPDDHHVVLVIARLLAHLTARPAPPGLKRTLADIAPALLDRARRALPDIPDPAVRRLLADSAAAVREVADTPGDRLLHWDLHDENVLGADRAEWLAIDPKPLAGDPGFELWPALVNRFDPADVRWRFDAMTDVLALDRPRARAWTGARLLQICLWKIENGERPEEEWLETGHRLRP
ncbi:aminoglycoside phosphotransferase family protein [Streptomyces sp. XM83C]|jgi:streptomycin 6-kinase|uniref:Aminoglycoside phosphotransferase family protein n=1 Tax=Streptomyces thermocoprophilus TaxID=78356 RepID=A0ABV5VN75_9ACTN|nr:aminoglycoside phosphotransferase family protein [Streptomyces sp. XM83C]MCK1821271.1 aminoglycoside phosphotransferase family protein [Streptomyces sp. XM83C]